jgi:hypothetical protein
MNAAPVFPNPGNAQQRIDAWESAACLLQELPREAVSFPRTCRQRAVVAMETFAQPARTKAFFAVDEQAAITLSRAEFNQPAVNEVADFDWSEWRLREISYDWNFNRPFFAPILVNKDSAAVTIDLPRPLADAHTY